MEAELAVVVTEGDLRGAEGKKTTWSEKEKKKKNFFLVDQLDD